jgi:hypothetical protein
MGEKEKGLSIQIPTLYMKVFSCPLRFTETKLSEEKTSELSENL